MMKKRKTRRRSEPKTCVFHRTIHFRDYGVEVRDYCLEVECTLHKATWSCITIKIEDAIELARVFPLVHGGLAMGHEAFPIPNACILAHIPREPFRGDEVTK